MKMGPVQNKNKEDNETKNVGRETPKEKKDTKYYRQKIKMVKKECKSRVKEMILRPAQKGTRIFTPLNVCNFLLKFPPGCFHLENDGLF